MAKEHALRDELKKLQAQGFMLSEIEAIARDYMAAEARIKAGKVYRSELDDVDFMTEYQQEVMQAYREGRLEIMPDEPAAPAAPAE